MEKQLHSNQIGVRNMGATTEMHQHQINILSLEDEDNDLQNTSYIQDRSGMAEFDNIASQSFGGAVQAF